MRKSFSFILGVLLAVAGSTVAQIPISSLPPATVPLSGNEQVILNQGNPGVTKRAPVSAIGSATIGKPAGSFQPFFQSGDVQWNNNGVMFGTDQFIMGLAIPLPDGTNGTAFLLSSGYGPGGSPHPGQGWIITDQAFDNFTPGNTLGITAGETQGAGTANGGLLWLLGGASFGGKGGQLLLQGGTSANGAGGDTILQGGNATGGTAAAIPGDVFVEGGNTGRQGANVQLISTTLNGISGTIRLRNNSTFLWDFNADGSIFSYLGGGYGTSGNALITQGVGLPAKWSPVVTGPAGANTQIQFNNSGVLGASADFTFNSGTRTLNVGSTGAFLMEPVANAAGAGRQLTIRSGASSLAGNSGGALDIRAGAANGAATGATVLLTGGSGGTTGQGGAVQIQGGPAGTTSGNGGGITITGNTPTNGNGGPVSLIGGDGASGNHPGGTAGINGGNAVGNSQGGAATITGGNALGTGIGGTVNINGGTSVAALPGGQVLLNGGASSGSGAGGNVTLSGGPANGTGASGNITLKSGDTFNGGNTGTVNITSGTANAGGTSGNVIIGTGSPVAGNLLMSGSIVNVTANGAVTLAGGTSGTFSTIVAAPVALGGSFGLQVTAGSNASDLIMQVKDDTGAITHLNWFGDGGMVMAGATGGDKGFGTINVAGGFYQNGVKLIPTINCNTACDVTGMPVGATAQIMKTAQTVRASTTTQTPDPDLQFTNVPIGRYILKISTEAEWSATTAGFVSTIPNVSNPAGTVLNQLDCTGTSTAAGLFRSTLPALQTCQSTAASGFTHNLVEAGVLVSGVSTIALNWAQNVSSASPSALDADSYMQLTRLQ